MVWESTGPTGKRYRSWVFTNSFYSWSWTSIPGLRFLHLQNKEDYICIKKKSTHTHTHTQIYIHTVQLRKTESRRIAGNILTVVFCRCLCFLLLPSLFLNFYKMTMCAIYKVIIIFNGWSRFFDSEPLLTLKTSMILCTRLGKTGQDSQCLGILRQNPFCLLLLPIFCPLPFSFAFLPESGHQRERRIYLSNAWDRGKTLTWKAFVFFPTSLTNDF